ncbi:ATP-binding protein [Streptomyces flavidovirens]|uniref:ATP-binding protein n=1 Tax=Streptomyces flavidovirens TaxID=67298 RepID=UPI001FCC2972|nr:ATP-binding protein [Streptomyces flavidovirens]
MNDPQDSPVGAPAVPVSIGRMTLYPAPESVARARCWFRKFIDREELACSLDDCVLMISELVTNAVLYGEAEDPWRVRVEWWRIGHSLRVDVHNPGFPARVRMHKPTANDEHGRGLRLVDALADSWCAGPSPFGGTRVSFSINDAWKP